jgi:hypothetical protein
MPPASVSLADQHRHALAPGHDAKVVGRRLAEQVHHVEPRLVLHEEAPNASAGVEPDAVLDGQRRGDDDRVQLGRTANTSAVLNGAVSQLRRLCGFLALILA